MWPVCYVAIEKAPNKVGDPAKIFSTKMFTVPLVLAICAKMQQEGDKLKETLINKKKPRLSDLEAFQKLQWPNDDKIKYLSTKAGDMAVESFVKIPESLVHYKIIRVPFS